MANIPLRTYLREIEGLVDSGQLEETVAHCRYILQFFPKHVDTYRLLGKVFLEGKQFSNASDILQRVLSAVPDDFVSHVGMSIIREDEGNLDAAIWHMERAFETQPANKAIQDELKRLYGRRDGVEPPKIRLTRGALARMYVKGNLYDQAIAELRGALSEDPQRPDLQLLLAQMNFLSGNRVEAVETSSNILKKFPYCLIANRILALILPQTERSEDAKVYHQRAIALDPYFKKAGEDVVTSDDVPDSAVLLETLERKPGEPFEGLTEQPAWATSLGIKLEAGEDEELPEWLTEDLVVPSYEGEQVAPFVEGEVEEISEAEVEGESLIPEWMKEAGWQPTAEEVEGPTPGDEIGESLEVESEIAKAEIPDWLKDMANVEAMEDETTVEAISEDELPPWLDETPPGPTDSIISWLGEKEEISETSETESLEEGKEEVEIPDWLKELDQEKEEEVDFSPGISPPSIEELEELGELQAETSEETPGSLIDEADHVSATSYETDVIIEAEGAESLEGQLVGEEDLEEEITEEPLVLPEWLQDAETDLSVSTIPEDTLDEKLEEPVETLDLTVEEEIEIPDWLENLDEEIEAEPIFDETHREETEIPEWLQELGETTEGSELPEESISEVPSGMEVVPGEPSSTELEVDEEIVSGKTDELEPDMQDSALAWLESLAAKQGVSEEELITKPEDRLETPPEWILEEELTIELEEEEIPLEKDELPDWLQEIEEPKTEALTTGEGEETEELPAWISDLETADRDKVEPEVEGPPVIEMPLSDEETGLAWLESLAAKQGVSEEELITRPEDRITELPTWVAEEIEDQEIPGVLPLEEELPEEPQVEIPASEEIPTWVAEIQEEAAPAIEELEIEPELQIEEKVTVDLNTGSLSEIENITGVGFVLAQNILTYREEHGPFRSVEGLKDVPGVDDFTFDAIKGQFVVDVTEIPAPSEVTSEPPEEIENEQLMEARSAIEVGDYDTALEAYEQLIIQSQNLDEVISVLELEITHKPDNIVLWQTLGDAYMRNDQFQKALEAYTKAEKLL